MALIVKKDPPPASSLPSPFLHVRLQIESLSFSDRAYLMLQRCLYPGCSDRASLSYLNQVFRVFKETLRIEGPILLRKYDVETAFGRCAQKVIDQQLSVFSRARVKSQPELEKKWRLLRDLKKEGLILYFSRGGKQLKQQMDEVLAKASDHWNTEKQAIVNAYWDLLLEDPWAAERHAERERDFYEAINTELSKITNNALESVQSPNFGYALKKVLGKSFRPLVSVWIRRRQESKLESDHIIFDYLIFKAVIFFNSLLCKSLRETLEPLIAITPEKLKQLTAKKKAHTQLLLAHYLERLRSPQCCIDKEKLPQKWISFSTEEFVTAFIEINRKERNKSLEKITELQKITDEDCLAWAKQQWNFDPKELQQVLDKETDYDKKVIQFLSLTVPQDEKDDLYLDVDTLKEPIVFFADRFKKCDEQALALFS